MGAILITGVSRGAGIGAALARRFAQAGARVAVHGYPEYDRQMRYQDAGQRFCEGLNDVVVLEPSDLAARGAAEAVMAEAAEKVGVLDGLVLNHAHSSRAPIGEWTAEHIDAHMQVNVRASMLMIQAFAAQAGPEGGAITLFTSGQYLGPMVDEIAYAVSKEAIIGLCSQAAAALAERRIRVNCVNPGPTDTGYLSGAAHAAVAALFPMGRWGTPDDAADLVEFLHSDRAKWITGQVIASEGGFRRG